MEGTPNDPALDLTRLLAAMAESGVDRVYVKRLAANDNSKQQVYVGPGFTALNVLPNLGIETAPARGSTRARYYAPLKFLWMRPDGRLERAPQAKLILYPQYPEVRFSGFLTGARYAPAEVMTSREQGRVLLLGIRDLDGAVIGYADKAGSLLRRQVDGLGLLPTVGIFQELAVTGPSIVVDWRARLLDELSRITGAGWITGRRLRADGTSVPCNSQNCGGYTLEAELGVASNARKEPDYHGWEIKAHSVADMARPETGKLTLMTQEPEGGYYRDPGFRPFMAKYGYADTLGRQNRLNFGGVYFLGRRVARTGLTMVLQGFDLGTESIDLSGQLALIADDGEVAIAFPFTQLLGHWSTKHAQAAFVPYLGRHGDVREYRYGRRVRLGYGTDGLRFLRAIAAGVIFYDPSPKLVAGPAPMEKRRSQLRVLSRDLVGLYNTMETVDLA